MSEVHSKEEALGLSAGQWIVVTHPPMSLEEPLAYPVQCGSVEMEVYSSEADACTVSAYVMGTGDRVSAESARKRQYFPNVDLTAERLRVGEGLNIDYLESVLRCSSVDWRALLELPPSLGQRAEPPVDPNNPPGWGNAPCDVCNASVGRCGYWCSPACPPNFNYVKAKQSQPYKARIEARMLEYSHREFHDAVAAGDVEGFKLGPTGEAIEMTPEEKMARARGAPNATVPGKARTPQEDSAEADIRAMLLASGFSEARVDAALHDAHGDVNGAAERLFSGPRPRPDAAAGTGEEDFVVGMRLNAAERDAADVDDDKKLDFDEFCNFVRDREEGKHTLKELKERFDAMDADGNGKVDMSEYMLWPLPEASLPPPPPPHQPQRAASLAASAPPDTLPSPPAAPAPPAPSSSSTVVETTNKVLTPRGPATVLKQMGMRVRVELEDGKTTWIDSKDVRPWRRCA